MTSTIVKPFPDYYMGALKDPAAVRYYKGDNFVKHSDGTIYNCHPCLNGVWPIRFEVKKYDGNFAEVTALFAPSSEMQLFAKYQALQRLLQRALLTTEFNMDSMEDETIILIGEIKEALK